MVLVGVFQTFFIPFCSQGPLLFSQSYQSPMAIVAPVKHQLGLLTASPASLFLIPSWHQNWLKPHCSWDILLESSCYNTWCQYVEESKRKQKLWVWRNEKAVIVLSTVSACCFVSAALAAEQKLNVLIDVSQVLQILIFLVCCLILNHL